MAKSETNNNKAADIERAIKAKEKEIVAIMTEKEAAANDAVKLVAAEKKERRAKSELEALQTVYKAATYTPPAPTDQQELLAGLIKYQEIWDDRVKLIKVKISEIDAEAAEIEKALEQAAETADAERTIELSNRRNEIKATREHLIDMLQRAEALPLYPDGAIQSEWDEICNKLRPEWDNKVMELKVLAKAYKSAADALIQMNDTIKTVRDTLEKKQGGAYFAKFFTVGESGEDMIVEKPYISRIISIFNSVFSSHDTI
ncbi:MAG: hypothetical protein IKG98_12300 [Ruminococcus sp.]|nr:hypothetical protein [Ruminococcus sp.]